MESYTKVLNAEDAGDILALVQRAPDKLHPFEHAWNYFITEERIRTSLALYAEHLVMRDKFARVLFGSYDPANNILAGVGVAGVDFKRKCLECGVYILPDFRGRNHTAHLLARCVEWKSVHQPNFDIVVSTIEGAARNALQKLGITLRRFDEDYTRLIFPGQ